VAPGVEVGGDALGVLDDEAGRLPVGVVARLLVDQRAIEGPGRLGAGAVLAQALDGVADAAALVGDVVALEAPGVVVDEDG